MEEGVSFIIPNRGGKDLDKTIKNINSVYEDLKHEIIVIEQADNKPFMRGQLFNIAVKYAKYDYLAFSDNDIYHLRKVDWIGIYENEEKPLVGFKWISQLGFENGNVKIFSTELRPQGFGAFTFLGKSDFYNANGFSNLCVGWGVEDIIFSERLKSGYIRIPQNLGHIQHPRRINLNPKNTAINREIYFRNKRAPFIDPSEDGYMQTTFELVDKKTIDGVTYISVNNISVTKEYKYKSELSKHFED